MHHLGRHWGMNSVLLELFAFRTLFLIFPLFNKEFAWILRFF